MELSSNSSAMEVQEELNSVKEEEITVSEIGTREDQGESSVGRRFALGKRGGGRGKSKRPHTESDCGNGSQKVEKVVPLGESRLDKPRSSGKRSKDENGCLPDSTMCHQYQTKKERVLRCTKCNMRRYCVDCIKNWYPGMSEEAFADCCPVSSGNFNCKSCLRLERFTQG